MSAALLIAALGLALVLAVAGLAKLADLDGSRQAVAAFGVPDRFAGALGALLPVAELATATLLVAGAAASRPVLVAGAVAAIALLAAFCAAIAASLLRGRAPDCHCFGQLHSAPAGAGTLARNGGLLSLAAFTASGGEPAPTIAAAALALAALVVVTALSPDRRGAARGVAGGLPLGSRAPDFELPALDGRTRSLNGLLRAGRPLLLVFADPDCGPCIALAPELAEWQHEHAGELTIAVIERAADRAALAPADPHGRRNVLLQPRSEIADRYRVDGTPTALLIGADGRVASEAAAGPPAIRALVALGAAGGDPGAVAAPTVPALAPLRRRELVGRTVAAWAAGAGLTAAPAWATREQLEIKCRHERCGDRCCPKKAKCGRRGNRKVCICPDGRPACKNRCCPETFVCRRRGRRRRCVCPDGYVVCAGRCVRRGSDPGHCGSCGRQCPTGTSCVNGDCVGGDGSGTGPDGSGGCDCPPGKACCAGACTDLNTDNRHCGDCGRTCPAGETCCDGQCRNLQQDHRNCGRCGRRCASDEVCSQGQCRRRCRGGLTNCDGSCVDTNSDSRYCGGCSGCTGPFDTGECCSGTCCDYNAQTCCPGGCRNLALDDENCGACGNACPPDSFCRFGTCTSF